jgi:hypothetical protein
MSNSASAAAPDEVSKTEKKASQPETEKRREAEVRPDERMRGFERVEGFAIDKWFREMARAYKTELLECMSGAASFAAFAAREMPSEASSNLLGVGFGMKSTEGASFDGLALRVYVRTRLPLAMLSSQEIIPPKINGLPTDVIPLGDLRAQARPTHCGVSIGHSAVTAGTLGCLVRRRDDDGAVYILSNNHVLANCNDAAEGEPILEPGPMDGGDPSRPIAVLTDFERLRFGGPINYIDAAIARVLDPIHVDSRVLSIGPVEQPAMAPALFQSVRKHGRTTLHTLGAILDGDADIRIRYGSRLAFFEGQLAISGVGGAFSDGGDSGSLVVDAVTRRPVALLVGGGSGTTFASPIGPVLDRFGIEIL